MTPTGKCDKCRQRPGVKTPVMVVPVKNWPSPLYLQYRGALCEQCAFTFTMKDYTDYDSSWYDMAADHLRSFRQLSQNPFPNDPDFKFEPVILHPGYDPVPQEECYLQFWDVRTLESKAAHQTFESAVKNRRQ